MTPNDQPRVSAAAAPQARSRRFQFAALGLVLVSGLAGLGLARCLKAPPVTLAPPVTDTPLLKQLPNLFPGWSKPAPDLVLVVTGQQHGYLMPCGCSRPQKGGLERRSNLIDLLKAKGWPVVPVDLGDVPQIQGPANLANIQGLVKYRYAMLAMRTMNYAAVGFGEFENAQPLHKCFDEWSFNEKLPRVLAANLLDKEGIYKGKDAPCIHDVSFAATPGLKVGVTALLAPSVVELKKMKNEKFDYASSADTLPRVLDQFDAGKADLRVLLYQGSLTHGMKGKDPEVHELVRKFPQFNVAVCLSEDDEPRSTATMIGQTMALSVGHKARYVGVVGVWKTGKAEQPFNFKYQLVELDEEFMTPKGAEAGHKIIGLMEKYTAELKRDNYLAKYPQAVHANEVAILGQGGKAPHYVGSEACKGCHSDMYKKWLTTPHSHAYQKLEETKNPSLRQYDPECIVCHTVGFGYKSGFRDETSTPKLKNVGCESCHGPGSEHIVSEQDRTSGKAAPHSQKWRELMNPYRTPDGPETEKARDNRILRADVFCQTCHDKDNDVHWLNKAFERKWMKIWHYEREKLEEEFKKKEAELKKEPQR